MIEETLSHYSDIELDGVPVPAEALFVNQLKTLPVRLGAVATESGGSGIKGGSYARAQNAR